jgi:hypothetical protein
MSGGDTVIDPLISLAFSVYYNKGVYALLLGSGVSSAAEIPTGWEIVTDLIRNLARSNEEDCEADPVLWYEEKYNEKPSYSKLLNALADTSSERNQLLKPYFEPTDEEREQGKKIPTEAHKAIAQLVKKGYIRVIITTNFDRLLEKSLEEISITPAVISTPDSAEGALPIAHSACTIIKVHGDYLDTRIKNTTEELAEYDPRINVILDQVFDEYGLIICGWSAEWDEALRAAFLRSKSRRFSTYFAIKGPRGEKANQLIQAKQAKVIDIESADTLFQELHEKVISLEDYNKPHPLSSKIAVASEKRYLLEDRYKIRLHDLVMQETDKVYLELTTKKFPIQGVQFSPEELKRRVKTYESIIEILQALLITGCYWGLDSQTNLWKQSMERIANIDKGESGLVVWKNLSIYPSLLLLYSCGIASIAIDKYNTLATLLTKATVIKYNKAIPMVLSINSQEVMENDVGNKLLGGKEKYYVPVSEHLFAVLRDPLRDILPDDREYESCFDRFEYLLALIYADLEEKRNRYFWGPIGRFGWKARRSIEQTIIEEIEYESTEAKDLWPPLSAGLFDGSFERFLKVETEFINIIKKLNW